MSALCNFFNFLAKVVSSGQRTFWVFGFCLACQAVCVFVIFVFLSYWLQGPEKERLVRD